MLCQKAAASAAGPGKRAESPTITDDAGGPGWRCGDATRLRSWPLTTSCLRGTASAAGVDAGVECGSREAM